MTRDEFKNLKPYDILLAHIFLTPKLVIFGAFVYGDWKQGCVCWNTGLPMGYYNTSLVEKSENICGQCLVRASCKREHHILKCFERKQNAKVRDIRTD